MNAKENEFAFPHEEKANFKERLQGLIGNRSVRAAAKDWGLPTSTINNYLHKGTEPALRVVRAIAAAEGVDLEWLATGLNKEQSQMQPANERARVDVDNVDTSPLKSAWMMVYESLDASDVTELLKLIHRSGVSGLLEIAGTKPLSNHGGMSKTEQTLMALPENEKERLLALHEAKKGASEDCGEQGLTAPKHKQAG